VVENTTNNYLKKAIEQIEQSNDDLNESVVLPNFIFELKMSNLLIPGIDNGDELVYETLISEDDDSTFLPLFTDSEEFFKHYDEDSEYEPIENEFEIYAGISADESIDGIIINVESESFEVTKDLLEIAEMDYEVAYEDVDVCTPQEIKEIYEGISNDDLDKFIADEANEDNLEGIMVELSNANVLNLVVSEEPLDESSEDGIIRASDVEGFSLCTMEDDTSRYGILFTSKDAISKVLPEDDGLYYYAQITNVASLFEFVLRNDMDGVIINPNGSEFFIPRSEIISQASGIELVIEDASLRDCLEYAFKL